MLYLLFCQVCYKVRISHLAVDTGLHLNERELSIRVRHNHSYVEGGVEARSRSGVIWGNGKVRNACKVRKTYQDQLTGSFPIHAYISNNFDSSIMIGYDVIIIIMIGIHQILGNTQTIYLITTEMHVINCIYAR